MRVYRESAFVSGFGLFATKDEILVIFGDVLALVMLRVQGPVDIPVGIGGWSGEILVLGLVHHLQIHPILVLALIIDLQAAGDITGFRIMPALGSASLIVLYCKF